VGELSSELFNVFAYGEERRGGGGRGETQHSADGKTIKLGSTSIEKRKM
jgi:hypothetical protein